MESSDRVHALITCIYNGLYACNLIYNHLIYFILSDYQQMLIILCKTLLK